FQMVALRLFAPFVKRESGQAGRKTLQQALEMVQANGSNSSPVDKRETLITLAAAQASMGDLEAALRIADTLDDWKFLALEAIAPAQARAGDVAGALRTAATSQEEEWRASALVAVAVAQGKAGAPAAAQTTLREVRQIADKLQKARQGR